MLMAAHNPYTIHSSPAVVTARAPSRKRHRAPGSRPAVTAPMASARTPRTWTAVARPCHIAAITPRRRSP